MWWCTPVLSAFGRQRQTDPKFEASFGYMAFTWAQCETPSGLVRLDFVPRCEQTLGDVVEPVLLPLLAIMFLAVGNHATL